MIPRKAEAIIHKLSKGFPVVAITGPRQSGKTTLAKASFPSKPYITLENPDMLELALDDPKGFLNNYRPKGAVLDEVQRAPQLLSYLQTIIDEDKEMGAFVLTGSQRFNLLAPTTPSTAGRVGLIELLPFSYEEIGNRVARLSHLNEWIYKGGYPPLYDRELDAQDWF
ncbi:MAG: AAA family ATPase, partial [Planctomycetota bacterium]